MDCPAGSVCVELSLVILVGGLGCGRGAAPGRSPRTTASIRAFVCCSRLSRVAARVEGAAVALTSMRLEAAEASPLAVTAAVAGRAFSGVAGTASWKSGNAGNGRD